ncbi:MAG: phosphate acyltransferase PlsX [Gammaproteobacteria bacterium]
MLTTVAVDAMGGDHGPSVCVPSSIRFLRDHADTRLVLVGDQSTLKRLMDGHHDVAQRVEIMHATQVVAMDESARDAVRRKKDSSMRIAIELVRRGEARACVSAGNTGALMATARFVLKTLPGIDRPAIISAIPAIGGHTHMLDLGANAHCTPEQLFQFALMGSITAQEVHGLQRPRVGLLNIGEEEIKGHEVVREAAILIAASDLNYVGFVEGDDIFHGNVDVVVTDGFTGNVALKTMEGVAKMIAELTKQEFTRTAFTRLQALTAMPALKSLKARLDPRRYNGASLVGLNGVVLKSHGGADELAFCNALETARLEAHTDLPSRISKLLQEQTL